MTTVVKITISNLGDATLVAADAATGRGPTGITFAIREVPAEVKPAIVLARFDATVIVAPEKRGFAYRFSELGFGRVLTA